MHSRLATEERQHGRLPTASVRLDVAHATTINVAVVDDDPAVRDALAMTFQSEGFRVRSYADGDEFLSVPRTSWPDCFLLDVHMPARSGLDILALIGGPQYPAPVIMITGQGDVPMALVAIKAGAHDFIEKPFGADFVIDLVREAVSAFGARRARALGHLSDRRFPGAETLTARETEVLAQIADGASNKQVARRLGISRCTVEVHRARIMKKLAARNTADLIRVVLSDGSRP